jgi:hypothetical protein
MAFPFPNGSIWLIMGISLTAATIFAMIDMFSRKIADNITNVLLPALFTWAMAFLFNAL